MKLNTQRRITYLLPFGLSISLMSFILAFPKPDSTGDYIGFSVFVFFSIFGVLCGLRMLETAFFNDGKITISSIFGIIKIVNFDEVNDCYITDVVISASRGPITEKCIVIELEDKHTYFNNVSNKKNHFAIKIIATESNVNIVSKYITINEYHGTELTEKRSKQRKNTIKIEIDSQVQIVDDIIDVCENALAKYETNPESSEIINEIMIGAESNGAKAYYIQIKNIIIPDMKRLKAHIISGGFPKDKKFKLNSNRTRLDSWNLESKLSKMLSELYRQLEKLRKVF